MNISARIANHFNQSAELQQACAELLSPAIAAAAEHLVASFLDEKKVLVCGNGGSAALAQHFAACMLHRFDLDRPGLAAISLCSDNATMTAIANDTQFEQIFSKQVQALGQENDILLVLSIGGDSPNILGAVRTAHERSMRVIALTGGDGGHLLELLQPGDIHIGVPHENAARVQEVNLLTLHALCNAIDSLLLGVE
ncbi:phosphoheptose isomerase [mine drainage metagenome]|uniref:Phosphoheptose isomerase n=1 Tax=mine drainage metagenome TaxID=410659 RepID=A0A1J5Q565_9ZZZZ